MNEQEMISESAEQDLTIALNASMKILDSEGEDGKTGWSIMGDILTKPNPVKMLAVFLFQMGETAAKKHEDIELDPDIWLSQGGVIESLADEMQEAADEAGAEVSIEELMPDLKQQLVELVRRKYGGEEGQEQEGQPQPENQQKPIMAAGGVA